jgi:hypothetical protein
MLNSGCNRTTCKISQGVNTFWMHCNTCSVLFWCILFCSVLFWCILFCSVLFYFVLFYFDVFYFVLFYSILFCSILMYSILFCSILFCSVVFYFVAFYFVIFCSILFYSICSILFYSILGIDRVPAVPLSRCSVCHVNVISRCGADHHLHAVHYGGGRDSDRWVWHGLVQNDFLLVHTSYHHKGAVEACVRLEQLQFTTGWVRLLTLHRKTVGFLFTDCVWGHQCGILVEMYMLYRDWWRLWLYSRPFSIHLQCHQVILEWNEWGCNPQLALG